jgi:hypothetical protein
VKTTEERLRRSVRGNRLIEEHIAANIPENLAVSGQRPLIQPIKVEAAPFAAGRPTLRLNLGRQDRAFPQNPWTS